MNQYNKQFGSSTLGLLAVTAIFVGLIAYATVAFEKKPEAVSAVGVNPATDQGLSIATVDESMPESERVIESGGAEVIPTAGRVDAQKLTEMENGLAVSTVVERKELTAVDSVQLEERTTQQLNAQWDHRYNQYLLANGRSAGRASNEMTRGGEFNFSMKLTSRARMDADSEMNSRYQQAYYANQYANYLQHSGQYVESQQGTLILSQ